MKLKLTRFFLGPFYTIGRLYIDGVYFCDTMEKKVRDYNKDGDLDDPGEQKIYGETAIPYDTYEIVIAESPHFKRDLPLLLNVKHFVGILIHRGRLPKHSKGCILVGENSVKGQLLNSEFYETELVKRMKLAKANKEKITIEIV